jgi:mRNA-degrading endonuclease RelE of RelBE toxin-antitoxin system
MEYQVLILPTALKDLAKIPKHDQRRIRSTLAEFAHHLRD